MLDGFPLVYHKRGRQVLTRTQKSDHITPILADANALKGSCLHLRFAYFLKA